MRGGLRNIGLLRIFVTASLWLPPALSGAPAPGAACATCHRDVWEKYRQTGMGRSFYRATADNLPELAREPAPYFHAASNSYFQMLRRGSEFYQRRYQLPAGGQPVNVMEKRIDYVMGSGNHSRAYLHRTAANTLVELPLAWYAEKGGYWAMNPGYDRPDHDEFRRPITYDCLFCHNAYPKVPAAPQDAASVYGSELPEGIDCQRCHGPAAKHIRLASTAGATKQAIRDAVTNPARLAPDRQMDICMSCHLETTSFPLPNALLRDGRGPFSFQPGEPLGSFLVNFDHAPGTGREDKFEIVNAAYRLRRSACFLQSANGKFLCTTCHNPHDVPRGEAATRHYNGVCRQCHADVFEKKVASGKHTEASDCISCHMPKRRTEDVVHVVVTDHYIHRHKPATDLLADLPERQETGAAAYRGPVVFYYPKKLPTSPESELLLAVAQVKQDSNLANGIVQLKAAVAKYKPAQGEYYRELGEALSRNGQLAQALQYYRAAVEHNPRSALDLRLLGAALRHSGQLSESAAVLKQAVAAAVSPNSLSWHELALTYRALGQVPDAMAAFRQALVIDPELPEDHNNLGILYASTGELAKAEIAFHEAIRIRPSYADAHGNLANLLAQVGTFAAAREEFETALHLRPADATTRYNFALLLGRANRYDEAEQELEHSLRDDPMFADAHQVLADLLSAKGQPQRAIPHYQQALQAQPDSARLHLKMGSALIDGGDFNTARRHLQIAAAAKDAATRASAISLLQKLGTPP